MASGPIVGDGGGGDGVKEKQRFVETKVYSRKAFKGSSNNLKKTVTNSNTISAIEKPPTTVNKDNPSTNQTATSENITNTTEIVTTTIKEDVPDTNQAATATPANENIPSTNQTDTTTENEDIPNTNQTATTTANEDIVNTDQTDTTTNSTAKGNILNTNQIANTISEESIPNTNEKLASTTFKENIPDIYQTSTTTTAEENIPNTDQTATTTTVVEESIPDIEWAASTTTTTTIEELITNTNQAAPITVEETIPITDQAATNITADEDIQNIDKMVSTTIEDNIIITEKNENTTSSNLIDNSNKNENTTSKNGSGNANNNGNTLNQPRTRTVVSEDGNFSQQQQNVSRFHATSDDSSSLNQQQAEVGVAEPTNQYIVSTNGDANSGQVGDQTKVNLARRSKHEARDLRRKLVGDLETVRNLVKRIEAKLGQVGGYIYSHGGAKERVNDGGPKRAHSEVASIGVPRVSRPLHQLSVSVLDNSQGISDNIEKEKRTPKANQFYRNSEFLLANDKIPPAESYKKSKSNSKKAGVGELFSHGFGVGTKYFKSCSSLLEKLMKHKHGWVFNAPVDVEALGLHDYFTIIRHPMDLGTVKTRLNKNWYKSPKEFAEDVRLTFYNAMTYNPKGQDVHVMAEQLSGIFEERWAIIESDYNRELRYGLDYGASLLTPTSRKAPPPRPPPLDMRRILDRAESMSHPVDPRPTPMSITPSVRTPAPKKPKAKDPNKRDMTYDEKQKLSKNLQSLPPEKLDAIVQIIKKRNSAFFQQEDEIEVDIDVVDAETLWELDRFVTNYKKSLSKKKRKAELAKQARAMAVQNAPETNEVPNMLEAPKEARADEKNLSSSSPGHGERQGDNSRSSSSSSDSGSSSSDSDSDSSSSGSEAGSPRT